MTTEPTTDRAAARDLAADAIRAAACPGNDCPLSEADCSEQRIQPAAWERGVLSEVYGRPEWFADAVLAVLPDQTELASLTMTTGRALLDEKRHYEIACEENARLRAALERVRRLRDALDAETDLTSPDDEITRGAAAKKIAAALDGWSPSAGPVPPPTDRAAVLREAADRLADEIMRGAHFGHEDARQPGLAEAVELLRRLAAEAPTTTKPETEPEWARPETEEEKLAKCRRMAKALSAPPVAPPEWATTTEWPGRHKRPGDRRVHATARFVVNDTQRIWTACGEHVGRGSTPLSHMPVDCRNCTRATAAGVRQDGAQPCSAALLPFGTAPADRCVVEGKHLEHATAEGRRWTVEEPKP